MKRTFRGCPSLGLKTKDILETVRRLRNFMAAARELGCSDSYIHVRFNDLGITLQTVLDAKRPDDLLNAIDEKGRSH